MESEKMKNLFSYDNPIWKIMGRVADVFVLTLLWALCCLPVITAGASTTALYYVTLKMAEKKEGYLIKPFFKAFRENLGSSTILWVIMAFVGTLIGTGIYTFFYSEDDLGKILIWVFLVAGILYLFLFTVIFPLSARLDTKLSNLFVMSVMVCTQKFSWVLLMAVMTVCVVSFSIFVFWPVLFFSAGLIALIHSYVLAKFVFPEYKWNLGDGSKGGDGTPRSC